MKEKYDRIGYGYNHTRSADPYLFSRMLALLHPHPTGTYLDIGCGTGNYTMEFARRGYAFVGVEPSGQMLNIARSRSRDIAWKKGSAENIPLKDNAVDGALASLTIHHWKDLKKGMEELSRVIRPEGSFVLFTATPRQMEGYWLNHYFPLMLKASIEQMPSLKSLEEAMNGAGLWIAGTETYEVRHDLQDKFLQIGKNQPKLYLQEDIRRGISSFADVANKEEVIQGLDKLEEDIETGRVKEIIKEYENDFGDYLFVRALNLT